MHQLSNSNCAFFESQKTKEGISLVTAVMDRFENLADALKTWLDLPEISEFIILDWSSKQSVQDIINPDIDSRIKLIRVNDESRWILSQALNLAIRFSTYNLIFKVDADIRIKKNFFRVHKLDENSFLAGNYKKARNDNERFINGNFLIRRKDFFKSGGFNEYIRFYGYDDEDLYFRLQELGIRRMDLDNDYLFHIPHDDRHANQEANWKGMSLSDKEVTIMKNLCNKMLSEHFFRWSNTCLMRGFKVYDSQNNIFFCVGEPDEMNRVSKEIMEAAEILAMKFRLKNAVHDMHHIIIESMTPVIVTHLYKTIFSKYQKSRLDAFMDLYQCLICR